MGPSLVRSQGAQAQCLWAGVGGLDIGSGRSAGREDGRIVWLNSAVQWGGMGRPALPEGGEAGAKEGARPGHHL